MSRQSLAGRLRGLVLAVLSPVFGRALFRLCLGRQPDAAELARFQAGLVNQDIPLPPCFRAMLSCPDAKPSIAHFLLLDMVRAGQLTVSNAFDRHHAAADAWSVPPLCGNPLAFWRGPPVAFLHLEKTGGGPVAQRLTEACHPEQIDPDPRRTAAAHALPPFAGRDEAAIRRRALIYGHYDLPALRRLDPARPVITMLRDPAPRIVSLYYYWRSINPDVLDTTVGNEAVRLAHDCDLLGFLQTRDPSVRNYINNFYARRLTGTYVSPSGEDALAADPAACLESALEALRGVEFVGLTERMADSLALLDARFGIAAAVPETRHNMAADNARVSPRVFRDLPRDAPTSDHDRALARLTCLDAALYTTACARFETAMAGCPRPAE